MIYVNIRGNIGNQLFQYACARKLQEKYKQKICLNYYELKHFKPNLKINIDKYILNDNVILESEKPLPFFANPRNLLLRIGKKIFPNITFNILKKFGIYIWMESQYKELPDKKFKNIYLDGYWQSDKYFEGMEEILKKEIKPKKEFNEEIKKIANELNKSNAICISIRRGDYISNKKYKKKFFICDKEYFIKAMKMINKEIKNRTYFVCSDDIEWVKRNIKIDGKCIFQSKNNSIVDNLELMANCSNYILSNSTYSWWAQYLSNNKNKIVIAPSIWFADGTKTDIYQEDWKYVEINKKGECYENSSNNTEL